MRSKFTVLVSFAFVCSMALAEEQLECGSAVEAADRLAPDSDKHCDYTKTGLNGVIHKALSGRKSDGELLVESKVQDSKDKQANSKLDKLVVNDEFSSPQQLQLVKYSLLKAASGQCPKGFNVEAERYIPTATEALKLELIYRCL